MMMNDLRIKVASIKENISLLSTDIQRISMLVASVSQEKVQTFEENSQTLERLENELSELKFTLDSVEAILPSYPKLCTNPVVPLTPFNGGNVAHRPKTRSMPTSPELIPPSELTRRHRRNYRHQLRSASPSLSPVDLDKERLLCELEILYEKSPIGMCLVDEQFRYVRVNQMLATINNMDIASHYGHTIREVVPMIADHVETLVSQVFQHGAPIMDIELHGNTYYGDNKERAWQLNLFPVNFPQDPLATSPPNSPERDKPKKVDAVAITIKDITDIKQKEEDLLREKKRVEEANQAKSRFLAHMSHELRTPMACIIGMVNFMLETDLSSDQQEYAVAIQQNANSLLQILNDILDLSKVEAGKIILEPTPFDIVAAVERVAEIFSYKINDKNLELLLKFDPSLRRFYIGDPVRLRQILWNLVGNSVKFTDCGEIFIEVSRHPGGQEGLKINVSDTGIGIPHDQIAGIFREFKQADCGSNRKYSGSGLGLAIVERLVHMMGGNVHVSSEVNHGTSFSVFLPLYSKLDSLPIMDNYTLQEICRIVPNNVECAIISTAASLPTVVKGYLDMCHLKSSTWTTVHNFMERPNKSNSPTILLIDCPRSEDADDILSLLKFINPTDPIILMLPMNQKSKIKSTDSPTQSITYLSKPLLLTHFITALYESVRSLQPLVPSTSCKKEENNNTIPMVDNSNGKATMLFPNVKVLVVEDNIFNQTILQRILQKTGCIVDTAGNGREAVAKIQTNKYDIVFMDLQMPILDGYSATEQIRKLEQMSGSHVPIIAVTAHAMSTDRARCLEVGMDGYITKPIDTTQVHATMTEHIGRKMFDPD